MWILNGQEIYLLVDLAASIALDSATLMRHEFNAALVSS